MKRLAMLMLFSMTLVVVTRIIPTSSHVKQVVADDDDGDDDDSGSDDQGSGSGT